MHTRVLGKELKTPAVGLGCMGMSMFYGPADAAESERVIHRALDIGVTFLDTSDMYGWGHNEELLSRVLKSRRAEAIAATKFGIIQHADGSFGVNGRPEHVRAACDASLRRLGIDTIDLYYQHRVDPEVPIEETVGAMAQLVAQGKVRYLGLSEAGPHTLRRACAVHPITALQTEYSLWSREPEAEILDVCRELGVGFVAYSPLGRGFLTGQIRSVDDLAPDDWRRQTPRFQGGNFQKNLELVDEVRKLAQQKGCTPAQLALAWLLAQGPDIVPIPGTRSIARLEENAAAADIVLAEADLAQLDAVMPPDAAAGLRYPEAAMGSLGQ